MPDWYPELLDAVTDRVRTGRQRALSAANQQLVCTYWAVGSEILARQEAEGFVDDSKGYTRFSNPRGDYITNYPATPSRPNRRLADLTVALKKAGLPWPSPSKKEQRAQRQKGDAT